MVLLLRTPTLYQTIAQGNAAENILYRMWISNGYPIAFYESGKNGLLQNYEQACKWWLKAANQGLPLAQVSLGENFAIGKGCASVSYPQATHWFRRAAEQGNSLAQLKLGAAYLLGKGVPQDYTLAHMWANLAGAQGEDRAENIRNLAAEHLSPAQVAQAQELARRWKANLEDNWKDMRLGWKTAQP
ncbi:MAG: sel1 repeat family protein [Nitrospira sp.]|nr:sel1 repeat family protein [Nitrospira sp.]